MDAERRAAAQREVDAAFAAAAAAPGDAASGAAFAPQTDPLALQLHAALKRVEEYEVENASLRAEAAALEAARRSVAGSLALTELQLFFARINARTLLHDALRAFNSWDADASVPGQRDGPHCGCTACAVAGRVPPDDDYPAPPRCVFKPAFEALLHELGISCSFDFGQHDEGAHDSAYVQALGAEHADECSPADAHLVAKHDWVFPQLGRRVWAAASVEDESVRKMQRLMDRLYQEEHSDAAGGA